MCSSDLTPERAVLKRTLAPVMGIPEEEVTAASLGLGGLGYVLWMSLIDYGRQMVAEGTELTGESLYSFLGSTDGLYLFGGVTPIACGSNSSYPAVCSFVFPFGTYLGDGKVGPIEDLEAVTGSNLVDSAPYLP